MHQIAERLEKLGTSEYAPRFAENRIDILVLSRSTGATSFIPQRLSDLARAHADLGRFDDTWRCIGEGTTEIEAAKDKWWEAEVDRFAGQIALKSPNPDTAKVDAHFKDALAVARQQQAKSWELRAAMSMARLRRHQGKQQHARELLAPIYGWFTEGFGRRSRSAGPRRPARWFITSAIPFCRRPSDGAANFDRAAARRLPRSDLGRK